MRGAEPELRGLSRMRCGASCWARCGRALVVALAMSGDRAGALAQARNSIERGRAGVSIGSDKNQRIGYLARNLLAPGSAYRIFATAASASAAESEADWREARSAAERALAELAAIPDAGQNGNYAPPMAEARALIAEGGEHLNLSR